MVSAVLYVSVCNLQGIGFLSASRLVVLQLVLQLAASSQASLASHVKDQPGWWPLPASQPGPQPLPYGTQPPRQPIHQSGGRCITGQA